MSTPEFFRSRLDTMIDLRHPRALLAMRMPWTLIEAARAPMFERRAREGRVMERADRFGATAVLAGTGPAAAIPR
jgi:IS5 family transposase